ncbi:unnamed protein product [Caenorhabditis angaria]|uniref:Uncharacterized protein n=1 Tax=Caenorhabditis angaria TaxID=860376 RepID=A0A9P1IJ26_9PELO|nr:unnamed protein product [Caenorhabditis angaria]
MNMFMFAQYLLLAIASCLMLSIINCGGKKKPAAGAKSAAEKGKSEKGNKSAAPGAPGAPAGGAAKPTDDKVTDDGNYEELAVPQ